jgi:hypothetical protein
MMFLACFSVGGTAPRLGGDVGEGEIDVWLEKKKTLLLTSIQIPRDILV